MNAHAPSIAPKSRMSLLFAFTLICMFSAPKNSIAQSASGNATILPFTLAVSSTYTYDQMLANPMIICKGNSCKITEFTISFLPKDQDFIGPFRTSGNLIGPAQVDLIKRLQESKNEKTRVFIENVVMNCNGTEIKGPSIVAMATP
jgi:hypothetical protein